ncbi:MAG: hypothetical protein ACK5IQ_08435 [Bacteroidales bacterium]
MEPNKLYSIIDKDSMELISLIDELNPKLNRSEALLSLTISKCESLLHGLELLKEALISENDDEIESEQILGRLDADEEPELDVIPSTELSEGAAMSEVDTTGEYVPDFKRKINETFVADVNKDDDNLFPKDEDVISEPEIQNDILEMEEEDDFVEEHQEQTIKNEPVQEAIFDDGHPDNHLSKVPLNNLKAGIGLNDKFMFIRELFDNNYDKYLECIDKLDTMDNLESAFTFLQSKYAWAEDTKSLADFLQIVRRRFV